MNVSDSLLACKPLINLKSSWEKLKLWLRLSTGSDGANNRKASYINEFQCDHPHHCYAIILLPCHKIAQDDKKERKEGRTDGRTDGQIKINIP